ISKFIFSKIDETFPDRASSAGTGFILGGRNYGQGSSREHAALAPRYLGIRAVIAESFARIHKFNLVNFGILPLELINPADREKLNQGDTLQLGALTQSLKSDDPILVLNCSKGEEIRTRLDVSTRLKAVLLAGGTLNAVKKDSESVET
ncbi:MAG: aconitate hydratase, partial [Desulfohalobiaceae bacterium]|nr:aconitate hydratase [Desulfohalobiaceae bacterium]